MMISNIGVVNYSTTSDAELARWAAASQAQMRNDVAPVWSLPAPTLQLVQPNTAVAVDAWIVVVDDSAQRTGLGFHEMYNGRPVGYVLVEYTKSYQQQPSRVFSHGGPGDGHRSDRHPDGKHQQRALPDRAR